MGSSVALLLLSAMAFWARSAGFTHIGGQAAPVNLGLPSALQSTKTGSMSSLSCTGRSVRLSSWFGRTGNNMIQFVNAVVLARSTGLAHVMLPESSGEQTLTGLFNMPHDISLGTQEGQDWWARTFKCSCHAEDAKLFYNNGCSARNPAGAVSAWNSARRHVVSDMLWPHVQPQFTTCSEPNESTLTIHGRYGDVGAFGKNSGHQQGRLYPCAFYERLVDTHGFTRIIFLTQPFQDESREHPCIRVLRGRRPGIQLDVVTSLPSAVCHIVKATNLVVPLSSLSKLLLFANRRAQRIFTVLGVRPAQSAIEAFEADSCEPGTAEVLGYKIEGFDQIRTQGAKIAYMRNMNLSIAFDEKRCLF